MMSVDGGADEKHKSMMGAATHIIIAGLLIVVAGKLIKEPQAIGGDLKKWGSCVFGLS